MTRDTFDRFQQPDRGLFGDNEQRSETIESPRNERLEFKMVERVDLRRPNAVLVMRTDSVAAPLWLPKSQIRIQEDGPVERKLHGIQHQRVTVTIPSWLAKEKGLI